MAEITAVALPADPLQYWTPGFLEDLAINIRIAAEHPLKAAAMITLLAAADVLLDAEIA